MSKSGHISFNSTITAAVNSEPLSLWRTTPVLNNHHTQHYLEGSPRLDYDQQLCRLRFLLTEADVNLDQQVPLKTAVQVESKCGGQGFVKCNCSGPARCQSNRCKCYKAKVKCNNRGNSRCHA